MSDSNKNQDGAIHLSKVTLDMCYGAIKMFCVSSCRGALPGIPWKSHILQSMSVVCDMSLMCLCVYGPAVTKIKYSAYQIQEGVGKAGRTREVGEGRGRAWHGMASERITDKSLIKERLFTCGKTNLFYSRSR